VTDDNAPAKHLYESCGFRPMLEFPVFYRDAHPR
jgi:ribosomal protein S18 acetylase RimI-like enzyme